MADLSQIKINDTTYDIKDATARSNISSEATTRANADTSLSNQIEALQSAVGSPLVASTVSAMTDTSKVYVYVGSETGYTSGNWYYYDGSAWVSGGTYNSTAIGDGSITVPKLADDVLTLINSSGGLTADIKQALLNCFSHVAWIDANGQTYYDALEDALYPPANLTSISCVYTQSGTVYDTDSLDVLKDDLVVTAHYDNGTSQTVTSYALSGTLTEGTSVITVTYGGKTTTFNVTVTTIPYVTDGLIAYWDAIDNTSSGHDGTASTWADLIGGYDLTLSNTTNATWGTDYLEFAGVADQGLYNDNTWTRTTDATIEVVLTPSSSLSTTCAITTFDRADATSSASYVNARRLIIYSDNTIGFIGESGNTWTNPMTVASLRKVVAEYSDFTVSSAYVNGTSLSQGSTSHSLKFQGNPQIRVGTEKIATSGNIYPYAGKIHAIRVYNRKLTSEELAKNLSYDNTRFSLGLTLS